MASERTLTMRGSRVVHNQHGVVFAGPRGFVGPLEWGGLARQLAAANTFSDNGGAGGIHFIIEAHSKDADAKTVRPFRGVGILQRLYVAADNLRLKFLGLGPSLAHEENRVYGSQPL